jgi:opacity protein-like surface antigen
VSVLLSISGYSQNFAIKSNVLYDATTSINLGVEYALTDKLTLDVSLNYNPWVFPQQEVDIKGKPVKEWDGKFKHLMIQPELRWWLCEKFNRHFIGAHIHYANYNVGGLSFLPDGFGEHGTLNKTTQEYDYSDGIQNNRFEGWLAGGGVSYGYHLLLNSRFSLEFTFGVGYAYLSYDKYKCEDCGEKEASSTMHYLGPTKAGISAIFMLK